MNTFSCLVMNMHHIVYELTAYINQSSLSFEKQTNNNKTDFFPFVFSLFIFSLFVISLVQTIHSPFSTNILSVCFHSFIHTHNLKNLKMKSFFSLLICLYLAIGSCMSPLPLHCLYKIQSLLLLMIAKDKPFYFNFVIVLTQWTRFSGI